ncbi:MAG TPA: radical SAM family heme chaperone HemW [Bacteroidia bacterium]|nr:radical SAM family heme chaperone HemW [Bacteroidia bacterium]
MAGLYFHIPFCRKACTYCNFHFSTNLAEKNRLITLMSKEVELRKNYLPAETLNSLYFGGGTPSLLEEAELGVLLREASKHFNWTKEAEITLEANPDDLEYTKLKAWREFGINRLSIGLQSFDDRELTWMNRSHGAEQSLSAVKMAQDAGFENLSIDLIYGSRHQDLMSWEKSLDQALSLQVQHISAYNLTIEERSELGVKHRRGLEPAPEDELSLQQFLLLRKKLMQAGYRHYEISNFALPGYEARHNSAYWEQKNYLGIGPSAHSYNGQSRQWNFASNARYMNALERGMQHFEKEDLSAVELYNEFVMTRLRTARGCDMMELEKRFGLEFALYFEKQAAKYSEFLERENPVYRLNEQGMLRADALSSALFMAS